MRVDVLVVFASLLGSSTALRRGCKRTTASNSGEGWYYTTSIDNINNVAADFCTSPNVIRSWNNIKGNLPVGINIKVPCRANAGRQRDCRKNTPTDGAYVIVSGDTLNSIAYDFCTNADNLQSKNSKIIANKDVIFPKQIIQVPCGWN